MNSPIFAVVSRCRAGAAVVFLLALVSGGCSLFAEKPVIPEPLFKPARERVPDTGSGDVTNGRERETSFFQTPKPPSAARAGVGRAPEPQAANGEPLVESSADLQNLPLPQFAQAVYGNILKRNISMDPAVQSRTDMVSLRTGKPQTATQLAAAAKAVLRAYGVAVQEFPGLVRLVPENAQSGSLPEIRRGRALPDVPAQLRPVFFIAELEQTNASHVAGILRNLFAGRLNIQDDSTLNAILMSGQSDTIAAAMEAIEVLDQPLMRGRMSARIVPVFWSVDEMAKRLTEMLLAEGYSVAQNSAAQTPILVLPVPAANSVIVFAASEPLLNHVLRWSRELDQPAQSRGGYITYYVRNTDAADLAKTLQEVITGVAAAPAAAAGAAPAPRGGSRVVVNAATNSLIMQASAADYQQWYGLLRELDRPARSALVMATVAEVRLTENEQFGFQWLAKQFVSHGYKVDTGTFSAGGTAPSASTGVFRIALSGLAGDPRALLTALASTNKIRILSNPSIMARNGEAATIQVGQEVPILTSQVSNANTGTLSGSTGILQTIQYRSTGVILKVKPVIHAGGRIDLDVTQEVSAAQVNETGVNSSPVILTRKVDTKLTVTDGSTILMGGLMQEQKTVGNAGIPLLKDIPFAGALFRTSTSDNVERTELVILLTPYVVEDDFDSRAITDAFRSQFAWAAPNPMAKPVTTMPMESEAAASAAASATPSPPVANEAASPATMDAAAAAQRKSAPYVLPEKDSPPAIVAPAPQYPGPRAADNATPPAVPPSFRVDSGPNSAPPPAKTVAPMGKPVGSEMPKGSVVTDERLKQELMEAIRGGSSSGK